MNILIAFFLRYLLAPILIIVSILVMNSLAKGKSVLKMKKLIIFILISALIVALPSLFGLLKYEFVWSGLIVSVVTYLILGACFNLFAKTKMFKAIGFDERQWVILFGYFIILVFGTWIYYLAFTWLSKLSYGTWAMFTTLWFMVPPFYKFAKDKFISIPGVFYKSWIVEKDPKDEEYWNTIDTFRLMQVNVKVKRKTTSKQYASFSVKLPEGVTLGRWFNRFIEDQNIRFPNDPIELHNEDGPCGWIFYTNKWFPFPLFTRMLDFDENVTKNKIKNKTTLYVRRVSKNKEQDDDKSN